MKNNTVGRITCPICGEPSQDLRVDKNNKLYMFCDNLCAIKLNRKMSREYLPLLLAGQSVSTPHFGMITSTLTKMKGKAENEYRTGSNGTTANRRADGQPAASAGVQRAESRTGRGWFAELLADDNE